MKKLFALSIIVCSSFLWISAKDIQSNPILNNPEAVTTNAKYELVWSDEFNNNGLPDSKKWSYDTEGNSSGWGNNEAQYYTNARLQNSEVKDGYLYINVLKEKINIRLFT